RKEGAVMSNIALAAYAVGDIKDLKDAISKWIEARDTFTPNIQNTKNYQNIFAIQQKLLKENMKDAFLSLAKLNQ
ncbi:hypothetical protein CG709_13285, partial [Lachnotalea glycerini]